MADEILDILKDPSWRGIAFPFTGERDYGFQQEQAQHRFIFRDQQLIESIGAQNPVFSYTIPFRERLRQHGWQNLFTVVYPKFLAACRDRSSGILVDPVHGSVRCKCASLREVLSTSKRDGVDVMAEFIFSPDEDSDTATQFEQIAKSLPQFQQAVLEYGASASALSDETLQQLAEINPASQQAKLSLFDAARSIAATGQQYKERTRAQLGSVSDQLDRTRSDIDEANDPQLGELRRDSARLAKSSRDLARTLGNPPGPFFVVKTTAEVGRIAFSTANKIGVETLLEFNPQLRNMLTIPKGFGVKLPRRRNG